jgi:hypothetical protein
VLLLVALKHQEIMKNPKVRQLIETLEEAAFQNEMMEELKRK